MTFPDSKFTSISSYVDEYYNEISKAAGTIDRQKTEQAAEILTKAYTDGRFVFSCGNGGSAAIANHLVCDHCKLVRSDTDLTSRIVSLSTTIEMITAIGNDLSYDEIFSYPLQSLAKPGDVLITVSSSGDSENIVRAALLAKEIGMPRATQNARRKLRKRASAIKTREIP